jgi:hypothetical protein
MKARLLVAGFSYCVGLSIAQEVKLPFGCNQEDIQWAGMTCRENEPCPIYLELSSVSSTASRVFLAGNIHSPQTTLYSVLLRSEDGGVSWQEPIGRVRGELLDHFQFQNLETGWLSGQRIVPLAGDPFFLITGDGGHVWTKTPVLPEGTPGFIQKFHFDTAKNGKLSLDRGSNNDDEPRYRIYETKDGGLNWHLSESSALPLKNAPVQGDDPGWRLRPDPSGKFIAVEHRSSNGWTATAKFTIQIGECREE